MHLDAKVQAGKYAAKFLNDKNNCLTLIYFSCLLNTGLETPPEY